MLDTLLDMLSGEVAELQQAAWRKVAAKRPTEEEFNSYLESRAAGLAAASG